MSSSQLLLIPSFFRGVGLKPPTRWLSVWVATLAGWIYMGHLKISPGENVLGALWRSEDCTFGVSLTGCGQSSPCVGLWGALGSDGNEFHETHRALFSPLHENQLLSNSQLHINYYYTTIYHIIKYHVIPYIIPYYTIYYTILYHIIPYYTIFYHISIPSDHTR